VNGASSTRVWIPIGAGLFLVALMVFALRNPQLRVLHVLQALIYVVILILTFLPIATVCGDLAQASRWGSSGTVSVSSCLISCRRD